MGAGTSAFDLAAVRAEGDRLRRWGRWGVPDGRGSVNLISGREVLEAARTVRSGRVFSLAMPFGPDGPCDDHVRHNPKVTMVAMGNQDLPGGFGYADDTLFMSLQASTQWDALSHAFYDGVMWNGHPVEETISESGTTKNSISELRDGIVGRGVLLDIARHLGLECLHDNQAVSPELLDEVSATEHVEVRRGDVVLVRTGRVGRAIREGSYPAETFAMASPGLSVRCAAWLVEHEVAAVAADNVAVEVMRSEGADTFSPLHMICQRDAGIPFGELFDLERLAEACSEEKRWEFLLVAAPIPIEGAVGAPVNPIAIL